MSVKLSAAAVVLLLGIALASLFPNRERDLASQPPPFGVALRRDAPLPVDLGGRTAPLPPREEVATTQPGTRPPHISFVPSGPDRSPLRSPPPMPSEYAAVTAERSPQVSGESRGDRPLVDRNSRGTPPPRETVHRIVDGDTLPDLAARYLGDAALADRIRQANQDRLPDNPSWLPIGIELTIPPRTEQAGSQMAGAAPTGRAETRLVPIAPAPVVADAQ